MWWFLRVILSLSVLLFIGCSEDDHKVELTIPENKMVDIMLDLRIIENQINKHHVMDRDSVSNLYRKMLLDIHHIDSASLLTNLAVLQKNPRLAKSIEDMVLKKITKLQEEKSDDYE